MDNKIIMKQHDNKVVYAEGNRCYKVFNSDYGKSDILNEALNISRVEETGLRIPNLLAIEVIDGKWGLVTEFIEGKNMEDLLNENPEKEDELIGRFVDVQVHMQKQSVPLLRKHRDKMNYKIGLTDLSATLRYDLHKRIEAMPRHNYLCHGDYNPSNVIIGAKDGKAYIVDWSHATQGNVEADVARTFMMFLVEGKDSRAYKYLNNYIEKTDIDRDIVLQWLPILAASQSTKGIKKQSEFLRKLVYMNKEELRAEYNGR